MSHNDSTHEVPSGQGAHNVIPLIIIVWANVGMWWQLAVVFTCSSQMTSNGEHLSIHVLGHWHVFYEAPIQGPRTFLTELSIDCSVVEFFLLMYARHESTVRSTHHRCFLEVPGLASLCHKSTWSADLWVPIFQSFLYSLRLLFPLKSLPTPKSQWSVTSSSRSFVVLAPFSGLWSICKRCMWCEGRAKVHIPRRDLFHTSKNLVTIMYGCISGLYFVHGSYLSLYQYCAVLIILSLQKVMKSRGGNSPIFFQTVLALLSPLQIHVSFWNHISISMKTAGFWLEWHWINPDRTTVFTTLGPLQGLSVISPFRSSF